MVYDIIIHKNGVSRRITGSFSICLSRRTANWLRDELKKATHEEFSYGWIMINVESEPIASAVVKEFDE